MYIFLFYLIFACKPPAQFLALISLSIQVLSSLALSILLCALISVPSSGDPYNLRYGSSIPLSVLALRLPLCLSARAFAQLTEECNQDMMTALLDGFVPTSGALSVIETPKSGTWSLCLSWAVSAGGEVAAFSLL